MEDKGTEYTVRDFSAVDTQVAEMAKREQLLTWRLRIENLKRLGMPLIYFAAALAIVIIALGIFFWLIKKERVVEVDKVVEITKEVPVVSEKIKTVEVPVYVETPIEKVVEVIKEVPIISEKLKIVEVPVYVDMPPLDKDSSKMNVGTQSKQSNAIGLNLPQLDKEANSKSCAKNSSHKVQCSDTYKYENGSVYAGSWYRGYPHGKGKVTFQNGSSIDGFWKNGTLQKVKAQTSSNVKALKKSVTLFTSVPGKEINSSFGSITTGHRFSSGTAQTWNSAYCYLDLNDNGDLIQISLSKYTSYNSLIFKHEYISDPRYSFSEFTKAQNACQYEWIGFN